MGKLQRRFQVNVISAINKAQKERKKQKKEYLRQVGLFRALINKIKDHFEVKRRVKQQLFLEAHEDVEVKKLSSNSDGNMASYRINLAKLTGAKADKVAEEINQSLSKAHEEIKKQYGGFFRGFLSFRKANKQEWYAEKKQIRAEKKQSKKMAAELRRNERKLKKNHVKRLKERFKAEVESERIEKIKLQQRRAEAEKLGIW